ncbi:MAG: hypothetical protein H6505_02980 [Calditrichaeota bacterium]|nr:hypothetical protein [Calditrichota bacterium]
MDLVEFLVRLCAREYRGRRDPVGCGGNGVGEGGEVGEGELEVYRAQVAFLFNPSNGCPVLQTLKQAGTVLLIVAFLLCNAPPSTYAEEPARRHLATKDIPRNDNYQLWVEFTLRALDNALKELDGFYGFDFVYFGSPYGLGLTSPKTGNKFTQPYEHLDDQIADPTYCLGNLRVLEFMYSKLDMPAEQARVNVLEYTEVEAFRKKRRVYEEALFFPTDNMTYAQLLKKHKKLHDKQMRSKLKKGLECDCIDYCFVRPVIPQEMCEVDNLLMKIIYESGKAEACLREGSFNWDRDKLLEGRSHYVLAADMWNSLDLLLTNH